MKCDESKKNLASKLEKISPKMKKKYFIDTRDDTRKTEQKLQ